MYKQYFFLITAFLLSACERNGLSPLEIKIDEDGGYTPIGGSGPLPSVVETHRVSSGETLFDIANKYNTDPTNLASINGIKAPYKVRNGQVLRLPSANFQETREDNKKESQESMFLDEKKPNKELDSEFAEIMSTKADYASSSSSSTGTSFNDQAAVLSVPKATKTATGAATVSSGSSATTATKGHGSNANMAATSKGMIYPVNGEIIAHFGDVKDGIPNDGINIKSPPGTEVKASADGTVIYIGNKLEEEFGNVVIIQHENDLITSYAHLKEIKVKKDAKVRVGDVVGTVGATGDVTEPQLHFEVMKDKAPVDPKKYLRK
jgi:murein DD-endopeptidase MepM/ murein hydrolase activator NlpD